VTNIKVQLVKFSIPLTTYWSNMLVPSSTKKLI